MTFYYFDILSAISFIVISTLIMMVISLIITMMQKQKIDTQELDIDDF